MLLQSIYSLIFPSFCLHCLEELPDELKLLCPTCLDLLIGAPSAQNSCFQHEGPIMSLLSAFRDKDMPFLAESLAGFMLMHYEKKDLPLPEIITFLPQPLIETTLRGYNPSALLAHALAKMVQADCKSIKALQERTKKGIVVVGDILTPQVEEKIKKLDTIHTFDLLFLVKREDSTKKTNTVTTV